MEGYYCRLGCAPLQHQMSQCVPNGFNREVEGLTCDNRSNSRDVEAMVEVHEEEEEEAEPPRKRMKTTANNTEMVNETTVTNSVPLLQQGDSVSNDSNSNSNAGEDLQLQFNGDELLLMCEAVSEETLKYVFEDD
ncbi:hypothetical protein SAY87_005795 [Trapa incisa]|uniref:Uncharacterized protein n=1 Tax=Trapa incisa TaxID=236973 RepID=A0AAN7K711_9MYRT|nr:hypothetical protein SAY87_005795 [Trapa incisa]